MLGIVYGNIVILTLIFVASVISLFFCTIPRRNVLASIILPYFVILLLLGSVIIVGPFIDRTEDQQVKNLMTKSALYVNPVIILTRSLGKIDIMRTDYMYTIADPLVGRGFSYPDWRISCIIHFVVSFFLLFITFLFTYIRRNSIT